jgi:hypothetical protein
MDTPEAGWYPDPTGTNVPARATATPGRREVTA